MNDERQGSRILVADDDAAVRRVLVRILERDGYTVDAAEDGTQAATMVGQHDYDVILTDIDMPGLTGVALLREIRSRDLDVPVILVTGYPSVDTAVEAVEYGALRYLRKPVLSEDLSKSVRFAVRAHKLARLKREAFAAIGRDAGQAGDRAGLEAGFSRAMEGLWMAYQPIVSFSSQRIVAYEALLRSLEPSLPHPGAVLDAAEQLGNVHALGRRIRDRIAEDAADLPGDAKLFVNLHPHDLLDDSLFDQGAPLTALAHRVVLEITERATLDGIDNISARIAKLRELGYLLAVDDLGAGYAGLATFVDIQPELIKLDMALIRDVDANETKERVVRSMVELCQSMSVAVIVEGVETSSERDVLAALGADLMQGFWFARPERPYAMVSQGSFA